MEEYSILVFDDNIYDFELIKRELLKAPFSATINHIKSLDDFVDSVQDTTYDIIILDHNLISINSFHVLDVVKELELCIPIVIASESITEKDVAKLILEYNVRDVILKENINRLTSVLIKELHNSSMLKQLEEKNEKLKVLSLAARHTHNGVVITNVEGEIVWVNRGFTTLTEYSLEEVRGTKPGHFLQGKNSEIETVQRIRKNLELLVPFSEEIKNYSKNGVEYWIKLDITPIFENQKHVGFVGIQEDITKRKNAELKLAKNEQLFHSLTQNLPGVVLRYSYGEENPGTIEYISVQCFEVYGLTQEEILLNNDSLWGLVDEHQIEDIQNSIKKSAEELSLWTYEYKITTPAGECKWLRASGTPRMATQCGAVVWDTIVLDITKEISTEQELLNSNKRLLNAQKAGKIGDWQVDLPSLNVSWSEQLFEIYEREVSQGNPTAEEVIGYISENTGSFIELNERARSQGIPYEMEMTIVTEKNTTKHLNLVGIPNHNKDGDVVSIMGTVQDITNLSVAMRKIQDNEHRMDAAIEGADLGVWDLNILTEEFVVNDRWLEMLGYVPGEISLSPSCVTQLIHPEDQDKLPAKMVELKEGANRFEVTLKIKHKDGEYRYVQSRGRVTERNEKKEPIRLIGTHLDITESYTLQKKLTNSLKEKTVLLQEIHHRVKNNLAVIIGLLHLQAFKTESTELVELYDTFSYRIKSIADVHEMLYNSENLSEINLNGYVKKLCDNIIRMGANDKDVEYLLFIEENFELDITQAVPLGLLLNELLTNTMKHAFKEIEKPAITFSAVPENGHLNIMYKDNGIGYVPKEIDSMQSLGFTLIKTLLQQLDAKYTFTNGVGFGIDFKVPIQK